MDSVDDLIKNQIAALWRVINLTRCVKEDNIPCQIEQGLFLGSVGAANIADKEDSNLRQYFDECFNFIDEAKRQGGGVLVHCFVGRSRSVTIVVAYLMKKHGMSVSQALEYVRNRRPQAAPNSGFISQLLDFEKSLQGLPS
ncbi:dual specificity protein phosphatase 1 isoform X2 [Hevea brasiliensis]|uniref:dual specificity protein phosphatase 1 isoform X2 n=1 Tax=Hevea brasiliensis TaxID=3981 RepID=UPI000B783727|nr:dual specificity protein phosphatase 1 isoform X2 [Hevea brasiliensis]